MEAQNKSLEYDTKTFFNMYKSKFMVKNGKKKIDSHLKQRKNTCIGGPYFILYTCSIRFNTEVSIKSCRTSVQNRTKRPPHHEGDFCLSLRPWR